MVRVPPKWGVFPQNRRRLAVPVAPESSALVIGYVAAVEQLRNYETKQPDGIRVWVNSEMPGDGRGASNVKVRQEALNEVLPLQAGSPVAWITRHGAWAGRNQSGEVFVSFVREATDDDLQAAHQFITQSAKGVPEPVKA